MCLIKILENFKACMKQTIDLYFLHNTTALSNF